MLAQQCRGILSTRSASKLAGLSGWRKDKLTVGEGNQETIRTGSPGAAVVEPKAVSVIGAPLIYGQPLYGAEKAPAAIRNAGLRDVCTKLGWRYNDLGDLAFDAPLDGSNNPRIGMSDFKGLAHNSRHVGASNELLASTIADEASMGRFVLTLGGDHSVGVGTLSGILQARPNVGVLWVDAHADINTPETSGTGNIHGMPISFVSKLYDASSKLPGFEWMAAVPPLTGDQLVYVGLRDVDLGERELIRKLGATAYTMHDIDKHGIGKVMEMALDKLGERPLHVSYDIDACDPGIAPSTGTAVRGGLNFREAHYVAEEAANTGRLGSFDMVEVNPGLVVGTDEVGEDTVQMALALTASALGNTIL